jgi:hypothetical protein
MLFGHFSLGCMVVRNGIIIACCAVKYSSWNQCFVTEDLSMNISGIAVSIY